MIEELERLAMEATPGPWEAYTDCPGGCCWLVRQPERDDDTEAEGVTWPETGEEDARYIAACSPDRVLRLLEVVKQAKAVMAYEVEGAPSWPEWDAKFAALRAALAGLEEGK